ncbi:hypothetical protein HPB51_027979 [Rhipicephalus microplus]|uniref:Glycoside hydrolase family 38 N-terminal domain-containing protein n=1 Tax=Rhipicephalus microplus TaxID=6941 RepID=A0A9J6CYK3_RHIMP|nr:hypothetical protein HPB51_027979 [Rhipicephalus microplus]
MLSSIAVPLQNRPSFRKLSQLVGVCTRKEIELYMGTDVRTILDSVVTELEAKPDRRFIYVEMAFFTRWWEEQTPEKQASVRALIEEGGFLSISDKLYLLQGTIE